MLRTLLATQLSQMLDPRLKLVTIVDVDVAPDLRNARVFWSHFQPGVASAEPLQAVVEPPVKLPSETDPQVREIGQALLGVKAQLKRAIATELDLRFVPELHFRFDASAVRGSRIDYLLDKVRSS